MCKFTRAKCNFLLVFSFLERFDEFARATLRRASQSINMPPEASVYDYCVDSKTGHFIKWSDRQLERSRTTQNYQNIPEVLCGHIVRCVCMF